MSAMIKSIALLSGRPKEIQELFPADIQEAQVADIGEGDAEAPNDTRVHILTLDPESHFKEGTDAQKPRSLGTLTTGSQGYGDSTFYVVSVRRDPESKILYHAGYFENLYFGKWRTGPAGDRKVTVFPVSSKE